MSDKIINFDMFSKTKKYRQNKKSFKWPGSCIITGMTGTGKTNMLAQFILNPIYKLHFDKLYIWSGNLHDNKYLLIKQKFEQIEDKYTKKTGEEVKILYMSDSIEDILPVEEFDPNEQTLVVFDDLANTNSKEHKIINDYFIKGRHFNLFVFYLTQSWFAVPKIMRENTTYVILLRINNKYDLNMIHYNLIKNMNLETFREKYFSILKDNKYGYVIIDIRTGDPEQQIRMCITAK